MSAARAASAAILVAALAACTEDVPANAPPTVTNQCVEWRPGSHVSTVGSGGRGLWVWVYVGTGVDFYGWLPTEDAECGPDGLGMVWDAGW